MTSRDAQGQEREAHTCPDCGYVWKHGQHGGHSCVDRLKRSLTAALTETVKLRERVEGLERDAGSISGRMFAGSSAEADLEHQLYEAGLEWNHVGHDEYDCSLEIHGVPNDVRLSQDLQRICHAAGFRKVYVNHENKWETHYTFAVGEFVPAKGWRVSYPHRRGDSGNIWVEEVIAGWPPEWFQNGYVTVKPPALAPKAGGAGKP